jgi:AcrR family transcriptional regulator
MVPDKPNYGTIWYQVKEFFLSSQPPSHQTHQPTAQADPRTRILEAAFSAFMDRGFAETSTLEIARRAKVSKRDLYALVGNKQEMLIACVSARAARLRVPPDMPIPRDRQILARVLVDFGAQLVREVSDPTVIGVFRLAIAEAESTPEVARVVNSIGRETSRTALTGILAQALSFGLLEGNPVEMAAQFSGLLWGDLMLSLLLHVTDTPKPTEVRRLARRAATAFLRLHPQPSDGSV